MIKYRAAVPNKSLECMAKELGKSLELEYNKNNLAVKVSTSIGVVPAPGQGNTFNELYLKADEALYRVKKFQKRICNLQGGKRENRCWTGKVKNQRC